MKIISQKRKTKKTPATTETIAADYKKLVLEKMRAGLDPEIAYAAARNQAIQDHGRAAAESALSGVICEQAEKAHRSDPFANMAHHPTPPAPDAPPPARAIQLPANYRRLVMEKRKAGLDREQAEAVIRGQIENDALLGEVETSERNKKTAKA